MILADTSVLIDFLRGRHTRSAAKLEQVIQTNVPYGITSQIFQELLQGAKDDRDYQRLRQYLETLPFYDALGRGTYAEAARLCMRCRKKGVQVCGSVDCLLAQIAIENHLLLLHNDRDFFSIQKVDPRLKFF
jgi:predicted nucleic acid-binding protein